jgi:hypothetical protein
MSTDELVDLVAKRLREIEIQCVAGIPEGATKWAAAQLVATVRAYQAEHGGAA